MSLQKQTNLNIRLSEEEKERLKKSANDNSIKISEYVRSRLFSNEDTVKQSYTNNESNNTIVLQLLQEQLRVKDEQIAKLQQSLDQEQQLHQQEKLKNQLLLENNSSKWWQFWK
ncbi:TPA: hypothetical protein ACGO8M_002284 [Streptococcus suis]